MSAPARPVPARLGDAGVAALLALGAAALHARLLAYPALEVGDAALRDATNAWQALDAGGAGGLLLHALGFAESAFPARALALLLHAASCALAFALARRLAYPRFAAVLVGLLFAVHPLCVEALASASRVGILLGATGFLAGCVLALAPRRRHAAAATLALALVADPLLLGGIAWLVLVERRVLGRRRAGAALALDLAPLAVAGLWILGGVAGMRSADGGVTAAVLHAPLALASTITRWLLPIGHAPLGASSTLATAPAWQLVAGWLSLGVALAWLLRPRASRSGSTLGLLFFLLTGALHAAFPGAPALGGDAGAYLPTLGLGLALVALLAPLTGRPRLALVPAGLFLVVLAPLAVRRLAQWRDEETLRRAALAGRETPGAHVALGRWHVLHGRLSAAQAEYERALALAPSDAAARLGLGELELRRGLIPGKEAHFAEAARILADVPLPAARLRLGEALHRMQQYDRAAEELARALEGLPHDAMAHTRLGMVELARGRPEVAHAAFARATELAPESPEAWCGLGIARFQATDMPAAAAAFERALALEPDHVESNATLGRVLELAGDRAGAEARYRRAVGVNPDSIDALFALGALLVESGRGAEARRYLERVVELRVSPPHVRASLLLAELRLAAGEPAAARVLLQRVLAFNPAQAEARALLARVEAAER